MQVEPKTENKNAEMHRLVDKLSLTFNPEN